MINLEPKLKLEARTKTFGFVLIGMLAWKVVKDHSWNVNPFTTRPIQPSVKFDRC